MVNVGVSSHIFQAGIRRETFVPALRDHAASQSPDKGKSKTNHHIPALLSVFLVQGFIILIDHQNLVFLIIRNWIIRKIKYYKLTGYPKQVKLHKTNQIFLTNSQVALS